MRLRQDDLLQLQLIFMLLLPLSQAPPRRSGRLSPMMGLLTRIAAARETRLLGIFPWGAAASLKHRPALTSSRGGSGLNRPPQRSCVTGVCCCCPREPPVMRYPSRCCCPSHVPTLPSPAPAAAAAAWRPRWAATAQSTAAAQMRPGQRTWPRTATRGPAGAGEPHQASLSSTDLLPGHGACKALHPAPLTPPSSARLPHLPDSKGIRTGPENSRGSQPVTKAQTAANPSCPCRQMQPSKRNVNLTDQGQCTTLRALSHLVCAAPAGYEEALVDPSVDPDDVEHAVSKSMEVCEGKHHHAVDALAACRGAHFTLCCPCIPVNSNTTTLMCAPTFAVSHLK